MTAPTVEYEPKKKPRKDYDPDSYRMTIGEHLEELRMRLIFGLSGFFIMAIVCFALGDHLIHAFLRPLMVAQLRAHQTPQVYYTEVAESFMTYLKVALICAGTISSPWLLYQLWQFVAAGLYPRERKYITKYLPLSITLLITGMLFLYFIVLPLMMTFFLEFNFGPGDLVGPAQKDVAASTQPALTVPQFQGDPVSPAERQIWYDVSQHRLKLFLDGEVRVIQFGTAGVATPLITLATYIDMVVAMLLSFGLAFQMPLVVLALVRIGIVDIPQLKKMRRMVYFSMAIVAAFIVPDVVTGMVALLIPLIFLFEMGLWLAKEPKKTIAPD
jgi:Sec-independent protein secretion pathway component TatC